jgi:hypothetical protein
MEVPCAAGLLPFDYAVTSSPVELFRIPVALLAGSVNKISVGYLVHAASSVRESYRDSDL